MIDTSHDGVTVRWPDDTTSFYHYVWLRSCCYCETCGSTYTGERFLQPSDVPSETTARRVSVNTNQLMRVEWDDGHKSVYDLDWLRQHDYAAAQLQTRRFLPKLWDAGISDAPPTHDYSACKDDTQSYLTFLRDVRDFGFAVITGAPVGAEEIVKVAGLIGELADAAYSRIFDLKPDFAHSLGNTFHPVAPHTDEAYLHNPTGIQVLYCLHPADEGGDTILVDGFKLATELKRCDPGAFDLLKSQPQTFMRVVPDDGVYQYTRARVLVTDEHDNPVGIRFHTRTMAPMDVEPEVVRDVHAANAALSQLMLEPGFQARLKLGAGEAVVFDNHRVLHSRTGFSDSRRHLQICNVSRETFHQKLRFTANSQGFNDEANQVLPAGACG